MPIKEEEIPKKIQYKMKVSDKLKIALRLLQAKRPELAGLGVPIHIIKEVISELEKQESK